MVFDPFWKQERGSTTVMAGLLIPLIAFAAVGSVDHSNSVRIRADAQRALDSAVLHCATSPNVCETEFFFTDFTENTWVEGTPTVTIAPDPVTGEVLGTATINVKSILKNGAASILGGAQQPYTPMQVTAGALLSPSSKEKLTVSEIVLVLDVSSSMSGSKVAGLKAQVPAFINRVFDAEPLTENVPPKVSIIPYSGATRFPVGANFEQYLSSASCEPSGYCDDPNVWNGCFAMEAMATMANGAMASPNSIPWYGDGERSGTSYHFCPPPSSEAIFFEDSKQPLLDRVAGLSLGAGTGTYTALSWAYRSLEAPASAPFRNGVASDDLPRAVILFSDGEPYAELPGSYSNVSSHWGSAIPNSDNDALQSTQETCDVINNDPNMELYTSYFSENSGGSTSAKAVMQNCAPDMSNFWHAHLGNLSSTLEDIGDSFIDPLPPTARLTH